MTTKSSSDFSKVETPSEIISRLEDGMTIGIGGWATRRKPMALVREILKSN
ncbi:MAG: CoA-transferase, partial [Pseudomonadota bacterium]|nr:CoA-transferase [Pseudomonadota bacterium]